jgi:hypothetical protein
VRSDYERAEQLLGTYSDQDVGFVDTAVLAVVERLEEPAGPVPKPIAHVWRHQTLRDAASSVSRIARLLFGLLRPGLAWSVARHPHTLSPETGPELAALDHRHFRDVMRPRHVKCPPENPRAPLAAADTRMVRLRSLALMITGNLARSLRLAAHRRVLGRPNSTTIRPPCVLSLLATNGCGLLRFAKNQTVTLTAQALPAARASRTRGAVNLRNERQGASWSAVPGQRRKVWL